MYYVEYRDKIRNHLRRHPQGRTWTQLQGELDLPYTRPCPEWTKRLEGEIGLKRVKVEGRALVWTVKG